MIDWLGEAPKGVGTNGPLGSHNWEMGRSETSYVICLSLSPLGGKDSPETLDLADEKVGPFSTGSANGTGGRMLQLLLVVGKDPLLLDMVYSGVEMSLRKISPDRRENCG